MVWSEPFYLLPYWSQCFKLLEALNCLVQYLTEHLLGINIYTTSDFYWFRWCTKLHCIKTTSTTSKLGKFLMLPNNFMNSGVCNYSLKAIFYFEHCSIINPVDVNMNRRLNNYCFLLSKLLLILCFPQNPLYFMWSISCFRLLLTKIGNNTFWCCYYHKRLAINVH